MAPSNRNCGAVALSGRNAFAVVARSSQDGRCQGRRSDLDPDAGHRRDDQQSRRMAKLRRWRFKANTVDACLQWTDTDRVSQISAGGSVTYEKVCKKCGQIPNQMSSVEVSSKFAAGIAPGVNVMVVYKFPVVVWKGKKFVSVFSRDP